MAEIKPETLDFLYDLITPLFERQLQSAEALDANAVQLFTVQRIA
jgi:hypothetical protein